MLKVLKTMDWFGNVSCVDYFWILNTRKFVKEIYTIEV